MALPRSGDELIQRVAERWRWMAYRVRFHPWTTHELPRIQSGLLDYARLMRLDRPIGIWLLLWPTLWALWISGRGRPNPRIFTIFVVGPCWYVPPAAPSATMRTTASTRVAHQRRPVAAGRISTLEALVLFAVLRPTACCGCSSTVRRFVGGDRGFSPSAIPSSALVAAVPGRDLGWGIPMAFDAQLETVPRVAWLLLLANVLWVTVCAHVRHSGSR